MKYFSLSLTLRNFLANKRKNEWERRVHSSKNVWFESEETIHGLRCPLRWYFSHFVIIKKREKYRYTITENPFDNGWKMDTITVDQPLWDRVWL